MELMPGYKQSEVGAIPEDWEALPLKRIGRPVRGGSPRPAGDPRYFDGNFIPWLTVAALTNIPEAQLVVSETASCLTEEGSHLSRTLASGTLILANSGATLGVAKILGVKCCANDGIAALLNLGKGFNQEYLAYVINAKTEYLREVVATGNGQPNLNTGLIGDFVVQVPKTIEEQYAIARALKDADAFIESLEQLLAKKRQIKQGAMQELLTGKKRLPGFSNEWRTFPIGELLRVRHGRSQRDVETEAGAYPILATSGQIGTARTFLYDKPSVLIGRKGTIDTPRYMDSPFWSVDTLFYSEVFEPNVAKFLFYRFCLIPWKQYSEASGVPSLNAKTIEQIEVAIPLPEEQAAITNILTDLDAEVAGLETKLVEARRLKQGMMQELLTGRIRLVQPATEVIPLPIADEAAVKQPRGHNPQINEAVVIAVLVRRFASEQYPLGRKRRTKLAYLLHRHIEGIAEGFQKKAAGPYNPTVRYGGAEKIALKNKYVQVRKTTKGEGFVAAENIAQAQQYFEKWYSQEALTWLDQFRFKKNDDLELLTTVDMAADELRRGGRRVDVPAVKQVIRENPEWVPKLNRALFSDENIARAIDECSRILSQVG